MGKWRAECEAFQDNLKTAAARNAEQEQSTEILKQQLTDLEVKAANKGKAIENMEKMNDQLKSELEQLEHYNQYLAKECQNKEHLIDRQKSTLRNEKAKRKATEKSLSEIRNEKHNEPACNAIQNFVGKKICFKKSDQEALPQNEPVDAP